MLIACSENSTKKGLASSPISLVKGNRPLTMPKPGIMSHLRCASNSQGTGSTKQGAQAMIRSCFVSPCRSQAKCVDSARRGLGKPGALGCCRPVMLPTWTWHVACMIIACFRYCLEDLIVRDFLDEAFRWPSDMQVANLLYCIFQQAVILSMSQHIWEPAKMSLQDLLHGNGSASSRMVEFCKLALCCS